MVTPKIMSEESTTAQVVEFSNGLYRGDIVNNKRHGYGQSKMKNGHFYSGEYVNDKRQGFGLYEYNNGGDKYEGQFFNNKRHGYGVYTYEADGTSYSGYWEKNLKHGLGILTYSDGVVIKGIFTDGTITYGEITFPNGSKYIGALENYLMHGAGTLTYSDGLRVESDFFQDNLCFENNEVCCYCLEDNCNDECYESMEGICGCPEVLSNNDVVESDNFIKVGSKVRSKIIENDEVWGKSYSGIVRKVTNKWVYVKFDDGDYFMIEKDLVEMDN